MNQPLNPGSDPLLELPALPGSSEDGAGSIVALLGRSWLLIGVFVVVCAGVAVVITRFTTPVYESETVLRIEDKETTLPAIYRTLATGSAVSTEAEVLQSRALIAEVTESLGLQLRVTAPEGMPRDSLLDNVWVRPGAPEREYEISRPGTTGAVVREVKSGRVIATLAGDGAVNTPAMRFRLTPLARQLSAIRFMVWQTESTIQEVHEAVSVSPAGPDASIVIVGFSDPDPEIAHQVPNLLVARYMSARQDAQKAEVRSTVHFLREQLDTLSEQLETAESTLQRYREREHVVSPEVEANSQVTRLIQFQAERQGLESERAALAQLLDEVTAAARRPGADTNSPYRRLVAFPSLFKNQATSQLLGTLSSLENDRGNLLVRRNEGDPDVLALTSRIQDVEGQLRGIAATYLQGLTNQIGAMDTSLKGFGRALATIPRKQVDYGRLERQAKVISDVYTLVHTRLKEAEIAQAAEDMSVRVVDPATRPLKPAKPKPAINLLAGLMLGLVAGVGTVLGREHLNRTVRSRFDAQAVTGLPVLGLVPAMPREARLDRISVKRRGYLPPGSAPRKSLPASAPPRQHRPHYTFLETSGWSTVEDGASVPPEQAPSAQAEPQGEILCVRSPEAGIPFTEAYGTLLTNLAHTRSGQQLGTILFTSALPGDGKTTSAVNFCLTLPDRSHRVLLIDADLRRGIIHKIFGGRRTPGLMEVLSGKLELERACRMVQVGDSGPMWYLPTGSPPTQPAGLMSSAEMRAVIERASEQFDLVIIDSPPVNIVTDAVLLSTHIDGVVLVARAGATDKAALGYAAERLRRVGARVCGIMLNDIDPRRDAVYDRAYKYVAYTQYTSAAD